jgi:hypothetical protein
VNRAVALEVFLAQLLVDADLRARFAAAPAVEAARAGLDEAGWRSLATLDLDGLELAAASFTHKRSTSARRPAPKPRSAGWRRLWRLCGR